MEQLRAMMEQNKRECEEVLERLLASPALRFDENLRPQLPKKRGLYAISQIAAHPRERYLHAGASPKAKDGLYSRVWSQHFQGGGDKATSDLIQKVIDNGRADSKESAKAWIRSNCFVQWLVEEDEDLRTWTEHYMLSLLRPKWGR